MANDITVQILGTPYTFREATSDEDEHLLNCDGYCDKTTKEIVVRTDISGDLGDFQAYRKKVIRHEILHAFLFESGLHENWEHKQWGHEEATIDWIAIQFPKILKVYKELGCL